MKSYSVYNVFLIGQTDRYIHYLVKSAKGNSEYNISYNKSKDRYLCNCKNIKHTECKHIKQVKIYVKLFNTEY